MFFKLLGLFPVHATHKIFKPAIWLAGSTASQSEALLENPC